ncbi:MAG: UMP kinase [Candidatus Helarchaeota archaeon]
MKFALKIGGSLLFNKNNELNVVFLQSFLKIMKKIQQLQHEIIVIVGGGKIARKYIDISREFNAKEESCDEVGIYASRLNAKLIASLDSDLFYLDIPNTVADAISYLNSEKNKKFVLIGGVRPGQSTNAVAAEVAEKLNADAILNATDVDHVYSEDPKINPNAKKIEKLNYDEFSKYVDKQARAGKYKLFDYRAFKIIKRSKIKTYMFSGKEPENILKIINGEKIGTLISD